MAIQFVNSAVGRVVVPSAFTTQNVRSPVQGLSVGGILALIGEANAGPATSVATEVLTDNFYTPDQLAEVIAKYGTGNLVDAFRAASVASNDGNIVGAPTRIYLYKTNNSTSATASIPYLGASSYGTLTARPAGSAGNLISWDTDTVTSAVQPVTGSFSYVPAGLAYNLKYRLQGGTAVSYTASANALPSAVASNTSSLQTNDFLVTGGTDRLSFAGLAASTMTLVTSSGNVGTWTMSTTAFAVTPTAGDTMYVPAGSAFAGGSSVNCGWWLITGATTLVLSTIKLNNNTGVTTVVAPTNVATTFSATVGNDLVVFSPFAITNKAGVNRGSFASLASITACSITATGSSIVFTLGSGNFPAASSIARPRVGDSAYIPSGSAIVGGSSANQGFYTLTAVTDSALTMSRLTNGSPATVASANLTSTPDTLDLQIIRPYINGQQAIVEFYDGGALNINRGFFNLATTTSASFLSTAASPIAETGTDYQAALNIVRASDGTQENFTNIGGNVSLKVGYVGTTATMVISSTNLTTTVTGGSGANLSLTLSNYSTLADLVNYINAQTGYAAAVGSVAAGQLASTVLDQGTYGICTSTAATVYPGRVKRDSYDFTAKAAGSVVTTWTAAANAGLPEYTSVYSFLAGGAKGSTTAAQVATAIDAMENIDPNFIVTLFSQDATADITAGLTESASTYTIDGVNAYLKGHVVSLSGQVKRKKNRLGIGSFKGTFTASKAAAQTLASARYALTFQDVKNVGVSGTITQYQPWMGAVVAASMQAVGLYRSIIHKFANVTGIVSPLADFSPGNYGQLEDALLAGLLVLEAPPGGGFRWVSDQTTYGQDSNFVYNSLQVMYTADFMALDLARSFDNFAVGKPVSEVTASIGRSFLQAKMGQYFINKLIASSDGAPSGYDSDNVTIAGPVMTVSVNAYITNAISFVPITLNISQVSQTA